MIPWLGAIFLVVGFVILVRCFRLTDKTRDAIHIARESLEIVRNADLSEDEKERALQAKAKRLFRLSLILILGGLSALVLPMGVLWLCDRCGLISLTAVLRVAVSPMFLIGSGVLALLAFCLSLWWYDVYS